jgi:flavin-dependent dehydrogenase
MGTMVLHFSDLLGYAWVINRAERSSVGIVGRHGDRRAIQARFQAFLEDLQIPADQLSPYRWSIPFSNDVFALEQPRCGNGWLLVGDAAGFCDPLTAQGIHLALASAWAAAAAILSGRPSRYENRWRDLFGANLYFGVRHRDLLGSRPMTEQMLRSLEHNPGLGLNFFKTI